MIMFEGLMWWNGWGDSVCDFCIQVMRHMSHIFGLSYGLINVLLFVVLGPLSTLTFMASSVIAKTKGKYSRKISISLDIAGVAIILLVLIPISYAVFTMPSE